jgi:hypothetical protein
MKSAVAKAKADFATLKMKDEARRRRDTKEKVLPKTLPPACPPKMCGWFPTCGRFAFLSVRVSDWQ